MNRELLRLQRQLIDGPGKDCEPFDRYTYSSFSWNAHHCFKHAKTDEERELCLFLKEMAIKKSKAMLAEEQARKAGQANAAN